MKKVKESEQLWIDYLEDDLEPSLKQDLDIHLKNSQEAQKIVSDYHHLKSAICDVDDLPDFNQNDQDRLHDQIMQKVSNTSIRRSSFFSLPYQAHKLLVIAATFLIVLGSIFAWNHYQMEGTNSLLDGQDHIAVNPAGDWSLIKQPLIEEDKATAVVDADPLNDEDDDEDKDQDKKEAKTLKTSSQP